MSRTQLRDLLSGPIGTLIKNHRSKRRVFTFIFDDLQGKKMRIACIKKNASERFQRFENFR